MKKIQKDVSKVEDFYRIILKLEFASLSLMEKLVIEMILMIFHWIELGREKYELKEKKKIS